MAGIGSRLKHAWNVFNGAEREVPYQDFQYGAGAISYGGGRPDRIRLNISNEKSIISSIFTRLSIDVAGVNISSRQDGRPWLVSRGHGQRAKQLSYA